MLMARQCLGKVPGSSSRASSRNSLPCMIGPRVVGEMQVFQDLRRKIAHRPPPQLPGNGLSLMEWASAVGRDGDTRLPARVVALVQHHLDALHLRKVLAGVV